MRYQGRSQKSHSFMFNRENKENADVSNLYPCKLKKEVIQPKLYKKVSQSTGIEVSSYKQDFNLELKRVYSEQIAQDYSLNILDHFLTRTPSLRGFLDEHGISAGLRAKMVDWMIEVLSSYRMTEQTFFRSVGMMDTYLKTNSKRQEVKDLHLIGVAVMFISAKYEQIHPFKLSVVYDKIARKKFPREQILTKQSEIIDTLGFFLQQVNLYDLVKHILYETDFGFTKASFKYLEQIALYLSKLTMFNSQLVEEELALLAGAVIFISLKTLQQTDKSIDPQKYLSITASYLKVDEEKMIQTSRKVLDLAKNFSKINPTLNNLKKFNKFEYQSD